MLPISAKPFIVTALYDWCLDQGYTPHIVVATEYPGLQLPKHLLQDRQVVLNISPTATQGLTMDKEWLAFSARFSGASFQVDLPMASIIAIYALETQEGIVFGEPPMPEETPESFEDKDEQPESGPDEPGKGGRPNLRVVK